VENQEHTAAVTARLSRLAASGTRIVLCGRPPLELPGDSLRLTTLAFDNRGGARRLTEHLLSLGHRRIGYVAGPVERSTTRHRLEGHRQALASHGLGPGMPEGASVVRLTVHGGYDRASGYDAALELLRRDPGVTAIVAANDTVALGVCAALRESGRSVPADVSVAGFDDLPFSVDASPALTTVRIPLQEAGARAGRLVMGRQAPPPGGVATVATELMVRGSTAPPAPGRA
jgi:LacI family transcriptional regulator